MEKMSLPTCLQSYTFGCSFNQSLLHDGSQSTGLVSGHVTASEAPEWEKHPTQDQRGSLCSARTEWKLLSLADRAIWRLRLADYNGAEVAGSPTRHSEAGGSPSTVET